jgi:hypothetical protein
MATYTVELTSPSECDQFKGLSDIQAQFNCRTRFPGYFGFTFGAISAASFILNVLLETLSTCKCAINMTNEVRIFCNNFLQLKCMHAFAMLSHCLECCIPSLPHSPELLEQSR